MWCGCDTSYIVSVHIQCQASIFTLSLCSGHSWRVRLAKQETLTPPGHLVSPLVCRGPWMSTVVFYCWCHSDSASVLLYFTLKPILCPNFSLFSRLCSSNILQYFVDFALCPFYNLEYWWYSVFRTFLLHALTYWAEILHMTLFYCTTYQVRVSSIHVNFCRKSAPFGT